MDPIAKLISNPLLVLGSGGVVREMNSRAQRSFGAEHTRWDELFPNRDQLEDLLLRASGSSEPVLGALHIRTDEQGVRRFRVIAVALRSSGDLAFAIKVRESEEDEFAALTTRLRDLNAEIAVHRRTQAQLEEALAHNRVLYRELQHRVKNHLQMMLALVSSAGRESTDPGHKQFVEMLQSKLSALFDAQRLMYADQNAGGVRADEMLISIAETVQSLTGSEPTIAVRAEPLVVPNDVAFPVALIANELMINATKYGSSAPGARVEVGLTLRQGEVVLEVRDNGPGFDAAPSPGRTSSGLGLVRGLCRQIGGRLDIRTDQGAVVSAAFPASEATDVVR